MALLPGTNIPVDAISSGDIAQEFLAGGVTNPATSFLPAPPPEPAQNFVGVNENTGEMFVNGARFHVDDAQSALDSEQWLNRAPSPLPPEFRPLTPDEYKGYLNGIEDPSFGELISRNFDIGIDNLQKLGGHALQFAGAEETGLKVVNQQLKDLRANQPFQRVFTEDVDSPEAAIDWFVANLAQQGPNIIFSAVAMIAGALLGGITGAGLFVALGAGLTRAGTMKALLAQVTKIAAKRNAGTALSTMETKLLQELAAGSAKAIVQTGRKQAARVGGALAGGAAGGFAFGVADITGEQHEAGTRNRAAALALAIPYAAFEFIPEAVALKFFIKGTKGGFLKRGLKGTTAGAFGEGITETAQEGLLLSQNPEIALDSEEGLSRLKNSFAAGAGVGGAIGGGAVLRRNKVDPEALADPGTPVNLLLDEEATPVPPDTDLFGNETPRDLLGDEIFPGTVERPGSEEDRVFPGEAVQGELFEPNQPDLFDQPVSAVPQITDQRFNLPDETPPPPPLAEPTQEERIQRLLSLPLGQILEQDLTGLGIADLGQQAAQDRGQSTDFSTAAPSLPGDVAQEAQFQEAQQAVARQQAVAPTIPEVIADNPQDTATAEAFRAAQPQEPAIPTILIDGVEVPVVEALANSSQRQEALAELRACLISR